MPTRPADLDVFAPIGRLVEQYHQHADRLVDARHGMGEPLPPAQVAAHGLAALAIGHEIAARAVSVRWVHACEAIEHGATVAQVAAALDVSVDEVRDGLRTWADRQRRHWTMTADQHAAVVALVADRSDL